MKSGEVIPYTAIVNSGGLAKRAPKDMAPLGEHGEVLKALAEVGNPAITLIEHQVNYHLSSGATSVIASVGPHQRIADHLATRYGSGNMVRSFWTERALGTGGDLLRLVRSREIAQLIGPLAIITNADTIAAVNLQALIQFHEQYDSKVTIALSELTGMPNQDAYYTGSYHNVVFSREAAVNPRTEQDAIPLTVYRGSSTGVMVADTSFLRSIPWSPQDGPLSLYRDIVGYAINQGAMAAASNGSQFFMDLGTEETWRRVQEPGLLQSHLCY